MRAGFGQFCPVAVASDVVARRWTPIILRELLAGSQQFNEIHRGLPLISRPLLARRLRELEAAGVIRAEPLASGRGHRYRLTEAGEELRGMIDALGAWGQRWTARVARENLDPGFLAWNMRRGVALDGLPERRIVMRLHFRGVPSGRRGPRIFWLLLERSRVELCVEDPGFEVDLYVEADLATMARVWLGDLAMSDALRARRIELLGPRDLVRAFPSWWRLSRFAEVPRPEPRRPGAEPRAKSAPAAAKR